MCQRPLGGGHEGGKWEFPGGKLEAGESPQQALARELKEELDITVTVGRFLDARISSYPEKTVMLLFYECALSEGEPRALEHERIRFVSVSQVFSYDLADADRRAAQTIFDEKEKTDD